MIIFTIKNKFRSIEQFNIISVVIPIVSTFINKITHVINRLFNNVNIATRSSEPSEMFVYVSIISMRDRADNGSIYSLT